MTNYIFNKDKLKEILLLHKSFISNKCRVLISNGIDITKLTYKETDKFTEEFIDTMIIPTPFDNTKEHQEKGGNW